MVTPRVERRVRRDFSPSEADPILELLAAHLPRLVEDDDDVGTERIHAAVVLLAAGDSRRFLSALALAECDWRDVLIAAGLASERWQDQLNADLGER